MLPWFDDDDDDYWGSGAFFGLVWFASFQYLLLLWLMKSRFWPMRYL